MRYEIVSARPDGSELRIGPMGRTRALIGAQMRLRKLAPGYPVTVLSLDGERFLVESSYSDQLFRWVEPRECRRPERSELPEALQGLDMEAFAFHAYSESDRAQLEADGFVVGPELGRLPTGEAIVACSWSGSDDGEGDWAAWTVIPRDPR